MRCLRPNGAKLHGSWPVRSGCDFRPPSTIEPFSYRDSFYLEAIARPIASMTSDLDGRVIGGMASFIENFPISHEWFATVSNVGDKVRGAVLATT